jgi:hypothetical protein
MVDPGEGYRLIDANVDRPMEGDEFLGDDHPREWFPRPHFHRPWQADTIYRRRVSTSASANDSQVGGDHYKNLKIQTWDYITANNIGYLEGCAIKYLSRWKAKGGVADLQKARHYVDKLIELQQPQPPQKT